MNEPEKPRKHAGYKRWVFFFLVVAIAVHAGVFYIFRLNLLDPQVGSPPQGFVYFLPEELPTESHELEQRAFLFDSEPIFLPTTRNYSGPIKTDASVWEPEVSLSSAFPAEIRWEDSQLVMEPSEEPGSDNPLELIRPVSRDFVSEFGAVKRPEVAAARPGLYVEAKTSDGVPILSTFIELESEVDLEFPLNLEYSVFQSEFPEFSVFQSEFGLVGDPLLIRPSGSDATDNFIRDFIVEKVHPLLLGYSGYFLVRIGP